MFQAIRKRLSNQKGFTLVELMVVIAILGILAAIAVPRLAGSTTAAKTAKIQADLRTIAGAVSLYEADTGSLPGTLNDLVPSSGKRYLQAVPAPPDGGNYTYNNATGIASFTFNNVTYSSDGTSSANASPP